MVLSDLHSLAAPKFGNALNKLFEIPQTLKSQHLLAFFNVGGLEKLTRRRRGINDGQGFYTLFGTKQQDIGRP